MNQATQYTADEQRSLVPLEIGTAPMGGTEEFFHDEEVDENGLRVIASAPTLKRKASKGCRTCCLLCGCLFIFVLAVIAVVVGLYQAGVVDSTPYNQVVDPTDSSFAASHLTPRNREDLDSVLQKYHHSLLMYYWPPSERISNILFGHGAARDIAAWNQVAEGLKDESDLLVARLNCRESTHLENLCSELWTTLRDRSDPIVALYEDGKRIDFFEVATNQINATTLVAYARGYIDSTT